VICLGLLDQMVAFAQPSLLLHTHRLDSHFADEIFSAIRHVVSLMIHLAKHVFFVIYLRL
jgi:hypothetical protein